MISTFGLVSLIVASVAIYALWVHFKLMQKRTGIDNAGIKIEEALDASPGELAAAVRVYNDVVDAYNRHISDYPGKIMAAIVGFKEEAHYDEPA